MEFTDNYVHCIQEVLYFPRNVPTKDADDLYGIISTSCLCETGCSSQSCQCIQRSGTVYKYTDICNFETYEIEEQDKNMPAYECNSNCQCSEKICGNKLVQFGPRTELYVKICSNERKGYGLFTSKKIRKGNFICEYAGEVLTEEEAKERFQLYREAGKMNYIFCINEKFGTKVLRTFIDPTVYGNIGRYINHSCNSNSQLIVIRDDSTMPSLAVFSKVDIDVNEEITYNYGEDSVVDTGYPRKPCFCNEINCRKYLPYDSSLK